MKWSQFLKCTLFASIARTATSSKVEEDQSPKAVKLSFGKRYGESYEESVLGKRDAMSLVKRQDGEYELPLKNRKNFYSVDLEVGSPSQKVTVLLDTGSSDFWITGSDNPYCKSGSHSSRKRDSDSDSDDGLNSLLSKISAGGGGAFETVTMTGFTSMITGGGGNGGGGGGSGSMTIGGGEGGGNGGTATGSGGSATMDCSTYGTFNKKKSSTFKSNDSSFDISYGDGSFASGQWGTDHVKLGSLNISDVSIAVANETNSTVGVLGIGLEGLESTYSSSESAVSGDRHTYANFPMILKEKGITKKNMYSLFLNSPDANDGSIIFGAVDKSKFDGNLYTIPVLNLYKDSGASNPVNLYVTLQGLGMTSGNNRTTFSTTKIPALLDSGSTLVYLPQDLLEMLTDSIGATYSDEYNYYIMDCPKKNDDTTIVFNFGGFNIEANLTSYMTQFSQDSCALGILPSQDYTAILGDGFLSHAYVVYDLDNYEISLAQANYNSNQEDIEVVTSSIPQAKAAAGYSNTYSASKSITPGGNIFTSGTFSGSVSNPSATNDKKRNNAFALAPTAPTSLFATLFFTLSMFF